jgi:hypothetical protein
MRGRGLSDDEVMAAHQPVREPSADRRGQVSECPRFSNNPDCPWPVSSARRVSAAFRATGLKSQPGGRRLSRADNDLGRLQVAASADRSVVRNL